MSIIITFWGNHLKTPQFTYTTLFSYTPSIRKIIHPTKNSFFPSTSIDPILDPLPLIIASKLFFMY